MSLTDIKTETDVNTLVRTFYAKVRKDATLGPIFNGVISNWEEHFVRLTDFWMTNLFFKKKYVGNPMEQHIAVDSTVEGGINEMHFGIWLNLWFETIDDLFLGEVAQIAKNRARNMSTFIHLKIFEARTSQKDS